jgi:trehalose/maltose hydrolase-like predicted phosphorylase
MQEIDYGTKTEINSLIMERDILTKTIFRVYQQDSQLTKIQQDKLLTRYQHQLGVVVAQIEQLGNSMKHTDVNPLDEGMFATMDQKMSRMEEKLREISSQISPSNKETEKPRRKLAKILSKKGRTKSTHPQNTILQSKSNPLEIITLTQIPSKIPEFFRRKLNPKEVKIEEIEPVTNQKIVKTLENADEVKVAQPNICEHPNCENPKFSNKHCSVHTNSYVKKLGDEEKDASGSDFEEKKSEQEIKTGDVILDNDDLENDDDDMSKVVADIEKTLSNLSQAEVE